MSPMPASPSRRVLAAVLVVSLALGLSCADPPTEVKTATGGSVAGSLVGGIIGGTEGAVIGAGLGALGGGMAGAYLRTRSANQKQLAQVDPEVAEAVQVAKRTDAPQIVILSAEVAPEIAFPGGDVELVIAYRVVGSDEDDSFKVEEHRILADAEGTDLWKGAADSRLVGGAYRSTQLFKIPKRAQEGNYLYRADLKAGPTQKTSPPVTLRVASVPE
jgi:outer membrane lipoprotein SlyB